MPTHEAECHSTQRAKMEKISGSAHNFESQADKAHRFARGGHKHEYGEPTGVEEMHRNE
jgi:hypothetical protein